MCRQDEIIHDQPAKSAISLAKLNERKDSPIIVEGRIRVTALENMSQVNSCALVEYSRGVRADNLKVKSTVWLHIWRLHVSNELLYIYMN